MHFATQKQLYVEKWSQITLLMAQVIDLGYGPIDASKHGSGGTGLLTMASEAASSTQFKRLPLRISERTAVEVIGDDGHAPHVRGFLRKG
jgi:hypothetical protein